jgi:alkanesulfonate monooxygenase SsuD/methylene tetrahydromethanopterin reductase-like flavin-dependent oxidoreductase (luciferase family)
VSVGVIAHLHNPSPHDARELAVAAEAAGADWLGLADAFWWRDVWMLLAEAARATTTLEIGPVVTNPYLRHPFHTVAALATLQDLAGPRVFVGLAAGGSEVTGAAAISRRDAPQRVRELAQLIRAVATGAPLDVASGRALEVTLHPLPVLIAGRASGLLRTAGQTADRALLWAVPTSDLARSMSLIQQGATASRDAEGAQPDIVWAPLVEHDEVSAARIRTIAAYSVLNSNRTLQQSWGLAPATIDEIRRRLVRGGAEAAMELVPPGVVGDLVLPSSDPEVAAATAHSIGATSLAVPAFDIGSVGARVAWARAVLAA